MKLFTNLQHQWVEGVPLTRLCSRLQIITVILYKYANGDTAVSLGDILMFITGTDEPPPTGFTGVPTLEFTDADRLPEASTCSLSLTLSRAHSDYVTFKAKMDCAINNGYGFGMI